jgi:muramoyltetrapeptide carboxypeptidase LdcA involved in peptidoglycan recycling
MSGLKIGHCSPYFAVPNGARVSMDTSEKSVVILESGVK